MAGKQDKSIVTPCCGMSMSAAEWAENVAEGDCSGCGTAIDRSIEPQTYSAVVKAEDMAGDSLAGEPLFNTNYWLFEAAKQATYRVYRAVEDAHGDMSKASIQMTFEDLTATATLTLPA